MTGPRGHRVLPDDRTPWPPLARLGAFLLAVVVGTLVVQAVAYPLVAAAAGVLGVRPLVAEWLTLGGALAGSVLAVRVAESSHGLVAPRLGLAANAWAPRTVAWGVAVGALPALATLLGLLALGLARVEPVATAGLGDATWRAFRVLVPAAAAEEVLVRGYAFTVLAEWRGAAVAAVVTTLGFLLLHVSNPGATPAALVNVAIAGLLLAAVRVRTGSLAAAIAAHLAWNAMLVVVAHATVSGLAFATPGWQFVTQGPAWLTGGAWGPEGSLLATGVLTVAALGVWRRAVPDLSPAPLGARPTS